MKNIILTLLIPFSLIACTAQQTGSIHTTSNTAVVPTVTPQTATTTSTQTLIPSQTTANDTADETKIRDLVESFGKTLQTVSLLAPDAGQEVEKRYSEFVSPALLEMWKSDISKAPGRTVSSPWPDRIEITTLAPEGPGMYVLTGFVVEVTSMEVVNGEAAARIPVRVVLQKDQGRWFITEYTEER